MKKYEDLLKDERWQRKRFAAIIRDGSKCTVCGSTQNLQVHHTYYYKNKRVAPWDYPLRSLITVCDKCHKEFHLTCEVKYKIYQKPKPKKKKQVKKEKDWSKTKLMKEALMAERKIKAKYMVVKG